MGARAGGSPPDDHYTLVGMCYIGDSQSVHEYANAA